MKDLNDYKIRFENKIKDSVKSGHYHIYLKNKKGGD